MRACTQRWPPPRAQNWREIVLSDPDFDDWPLGERAVVDALQAWSAAGRSFVLLAQRFDVFERGHARFVHWRRMWSHIVECRACDGPGLPQVPSAHLDAGLVPARASTSSAAVASAARAPADRRRCAKRSTSACAMRGRPFRHPRWACKPMPRIIALKG